MGISSHEISFGGLFEGNNHYFVPDFQRDYSWTEDEVETLWLDIVQNIEDGDRQHFMGAIVLEEVASSHYKIIDGQQRFATISLLVCVLKGIAQERDDQQLGQALSSNYLGFLNLRTRDIQPKLTLNELNNTLYQSIVNSPFNPLNLTGKKKLIDKNNKLLIEAYSFFYQNVMHRIADFEKNGVGFQDVLVELEECIRNRLIVIRIIVDDQANAYLIFETLNDRGLELSVADLLKNYLFAKAGSKLSTVKVLWDQISAMLGTNDITRFIRHYWVSDYGLTRGRDLYRKITSEYRNERQVFAFVSELKASAEVYAAFEDPHSSVWDAYDAKPKAAIARDIELLNLFKVTQCYPVLLAVFHELPNIFPNILRMTVVLSFRYNIICGFGSGKMETAYGETAKYIRNKTIDLKTPKSIFEQLSRLYPEDDVFNSYFSDKVINNSALARYILGELNNHYSQQSQMIVNSKTDIINLEHIMPKKLTEEWKHISEDEHKENLFKLGNLTLLGSSTNRDLGNKSFEEKRLQIYTNSPIELTKRIAEFRNWGVTEIKKRQLEMAKAATHVWRLDY